jgi:hypothetical protein
MTIAICDIKIVNVEAQCVMRRNLNKVKANNGVPNPNFKGFMADSASAN